MGLRSSPRGFRASTAILLAAALNFAPLAAHASSTSKLIVHTVATSKKKSVAKKPAAGKQAVIRRAPSGLGDTVGLSGPTQLAAMNTALEAAPAFYAGRHSSCTIITPLLASRPGPTMAGNFRDAQGYCYVWMNLQYSDLLTGSEICKITLHEVGHLDGLGHSSDPADVMYAPFNPKPIPAVCAAGA
jgi:hypothetical protein